MSNKNQNEITITTRVGAYIVVDKKTKLPYRKDATWSGPEMEMYETREDAEHQIKKCALSAEIYECEIIYKRYEQ